MIEINSSDTYVPRIRLRHAVAAQTNAMPDPDEDNQNVTLEGARWGRDQGCDGWQMLDRGNQRQLDNQCFGPPTSLDNSAQENIIGRSSPMNPILGCQGKPRG